MHRKGLHKKDYTLYIYTFEARDKGTKDFENRFLTATQNGSFQIESLKSVGYVQLIKNILIPGDAPEYNNTCSH